MKTSQDGLALIKKHEGIRLTAYRCPAGVWTIGYGTTSAAGVGAITQGMKISKAEAESMLVRSLEVYERGVLKTLTREPTQHQFDAMVSLAYNIGIPRFAASSVARLFNQGDISRAANSFRLWVKAGGKTLPGLVKRREDERALFLK